MSVSAALCSFLTLNMVALICPPCASSRSTLNSDPSPFALVHVRLSLLAVTRALIVQRVW